MLKFYGVFCLAKWLGRQVAVDAASAAHVVWENLTVPDFQMFLVPSTFHRRKFVAIAAAVVSDFPSVDEYCGVWEFR